MLDSIHQFSTIDQHVPTTDQSLKLQAMIKILSDALFNYLSARGVLGGQSKRSWNEIIHVKLSALPLTGCNCTDLVGQRSV